MACEPGKEHSHITSVRQAATCPNIPRVLKDPAHISGVQRAARQTAAKPPASIMYAARALARRAAQTPALRTASARAATTRVAPQRSFVSKISRYEGMSDYMSLQQMQLIRDRLSADACGVGTVVSSDTFFYMCKRAAADLGVTDDALKKLISKIDENGDDQIQFAECRAVRKSTGGPRRWRGVSHFSSLPHRFQDFITSREAKQPGTLMDPAKVCAIRERLKDDKVGVGSEVSIDTFFMMVRYTCSDLGVTDAEILDLIDKIDVNGAVAASVQPLRRRAGGVAHPTHRSIYAQATA